MPVIKPFSGPRGALLWQYGRCFSWLAIVGAPVSMYLGYLSAREAGLVFLAFLFALVFVVIVELGLRSEYGILSFQRRLPVTTRTLVNLELGIVLGMALWFLLNYAVAYRLFSPHSNFPTPWSLPCMAIVAFVCIFPSRSFEGVDPQDLGLSLGAAAFVALIVMLGIDEVPELFSILIFACVVAMGYAATIVGTRIAREGGRSLNHVFEQRLQGLFSDDDQGRHRPTRQPEVPEGVPSVLSTTSKFKDMERSESEADGSGIQKSTSILTVAAPFTSPLEAQAWYELQAFDDLFQRLAQVFTCSIIAGVIGSVSVDDPYVLRFACFLSLLLWTNKGIFRPVPFLQSLPMSDWTLALVYLRISWPTLALLGPMRWLIAILFIFAFAVTFVGASHPEYSSLSGAARMLLASLWVGWISLALGPIVWCTIFLALAYEQMSELPTTQFGVVFAALFLCLLIVGQGRFKLKALASHGAACIAASGLVLAGYFLLPHFSLSPLAHWTCREALGALLILAMLHHHSANGVIPKDAARQLKRGLLGGVAALSFIILVLGPPEGPEQGITAIYLAFGVVPPLFLPFLLVPYYVRFWSSRYAD